jgi:hypothetical protein
MAIISNAYSGTAYSHSLVATTSKHRVCYQHGPRDHAKASDDGSACNIACIDEHHHRFIIKCFQANSSVGAWFAIRKRWTWVVRHSSSKYLDLGLDYLYHFQGLWVILLDAVVSMDFKDGDSGLCSGVPEPLESDMQPCLHFCIISLTSCLKGGLRTCMSWTMGQIQTLKLEIFHFANRARAFNWTGKIGNTPLLTLGVKGAFYNKNMHGTDGLIIADKDCWNRKLLDF